MNRQGPPGQPMRGLPAFGNPQAPQSRVNSLSATRMQNSKPANAASGWGFGPQNGTAPGLPAPQPRASIGAASFAQTIGGPQSSASLDLSEFPSLSGAPQSQFQNPGQAVWSNQRASQQSPVQRAQQSQSNAIGPAQPQQSNHQVQTQHAQQSLEDAFFPSSEMNNALEDYRNGSQGGVGQLSGQGTANAADEFPPLGRLGHGEIGQDRRVNMMQNAAGGVFQGAPGLTPGASGTPSDQLRQDQQKNGRGFQNGNTDNSLFSDMENISQQRAPSAQQGRPPFSADDNAESPKGHIRSKSPGQMTELDRFGLNGLLEMIRSDNSDVSSLAVGHDLTTLGLELNSTEPLHPTFAGPFAQAATRPLQPDYTLPQCYTVANTHPVEEKLNGLSDETLFWIFYNMPQDIMQERAACELTERNWRFHKVLGVWLTKEPNFPEPQPIAQDAERGRYVIFNHRIWQRESRDMVLRYADLDSHINSDIKALLQPVALLRGGGPEQLVMRQ